MILRKDQLHAFISVLLDGRKVIAPTIIEDDLQFREISDPVEVILDYTQTTESLKKYFLPQTEVLLTYGTDGQEVTLHQPSIVSDFQILFGVRPCDIHAVHQMPLVFRSHDSLLHERIDSTMFICLNCNTVCSNSSFCSSMNTGPFYHANMADIVMTDLEDCFFLEGRTGAGTSLLKKVDFLFTNTTDVHLQKKKNIEQDAVSEQKISFDITDTEHLMREDDPVWEEKAKDCFRCGGCNYICPTCVCYDVVDRGGVRERSWDSCLMSGFTNLANGENPRGKLSQRIAQRYLHKFVYTKIQSNVYSCVGCGRCTDICLFNDNIGETVAHLALKRPDRFDPHFQGFDRFTEPDITRREESMIPSTGTIVGKISITEKDALFTIALPEPMKYEPGQFVEIGIFGIGEVPVSIASPQEPAGRNTIKLVIKNVGTVTHAIHQLPIGSTIGIRGPYGTSWPLRDAIGKHVYIFAGGVGLCPLRGTMFELIRRKLDLESINLYYGAREPSLIFFKEDLAAWRNDIFLHLTVDSVPNEEHWSDDVGLITEYFNRNIEEFTISGEGNDEVFNPLGDEALAFVCGPQIMIRNVCRGLEGLGFNDRSIHVSLEKMMKCGIGSCGHCTMGELHVCRDGPIFSLRRLKEIHGTDYPF